ncbi:MAG: hypothetical protein FRX48_01539 [Lasallia pustulata]|uniref:Uncharacterized protein n=1 Tax=Lasallia pustulata TaxID=136370 RepID=A0A5M8PYD1_9LECA|nr:MAG: hypothetical protein FRX48_01539 [Lasallia pustulata]
METYAARLASFEVAHPATKRRTSNAKGAKTLKWPHTTPAPAHLAQAGFFYRPTTSCPDNATCFLCQKGLDGWEEDDDPAAEHLKHSPECGWAITVCIEKEIEDGQRDEENPMGAKILNARKSTFGIMWPHDSKRGWTCKTQKMVEAGWYYCPTPESDDFVKCPYCSLCLDGWEPKDNPYDEHQRRSPDCMFFSLTASAQSKPARSKKDRTSKPTRMSIQSNFTSIYEAPSLTEIEVVEGDSALTTATDATTTAAMPKTSKKGGRPKKPAAKGKKSAVTQALEPEQTSSFIEPEDDNFEVKVGALPSKSTRSKKRTSAEMDVDTPTQNQGAVSDAAIIQPPPAKRRATRSRSTLSQAQIVPVELHATQHVDSPMTDAESMPPPQVIASKKAGKGGRKHASSSSRIVSNASTASMASLRATVPADDEIDAVLEAELDRPLTDDEPDIEDVQEERPKTRRLTRTRPGSRKATASIAPVRKTRAATLIKDPVMDPEEQTTEIETLDDPSKLVSAKEIDSESESRPIEQVLIVSKVKTAKGKTVRKASASQRNAAKQDKADEQRGDDQVDDIVMGEEAVQELEVPFVQDLPTLQPPSRSSASRQTSRSSSGQRSRASEPRTSDHVADVIMDVDISAIMTRAVEDDSGHETDTSASSRDPLKKAGGKAAGSMTKGKGGKKSANSSGDIKDVDQQPKLMLDTEKPKDREASNGHEDVELQPAAPVVGTAEIPSTASSQPLMNDPPAKELKPNKRVEKSTKKKAGRPKSKAVAAEAPTQAGDENNDAIPLDTPPAIKSSPPPTEISDPQPPRTQEPIGKIANPPLQRTSPLPPPHPATPSPSPQSSDAENRPASAHPPSTVPPSPPRTIKDAASPSPPSRRRPTAPSHPPPSNPPSPGRPSISKASSARTTRLERKTSGRAMWPGMDCRARKGN